MHKLPYIADQHDLTNVLDRLYSIGENAPEHAELNYIREIDWLVGSRESFPQKMESLSELINVGLHSFQPLSKNLQNQFDTVHEAQIIARLGSNPSDQALFASILHRARRKSSVGIADTLPVAYRELDLPNFSNIETYWTNNFKFIHPLTLASEIVRHVKVPVDDPRRTLIGLDAFRQVNMPLVLELPLELEHKIGTHLFDGTLTSDFGQIIEFAYENVRCLVATILSQGRSAHQGTGNGFAILAEHARIRDQRLTST